MAPPTHTTPYLDLILGPCAASCLFIGMYAVLGIGLDWHGGTWRGDLLILLLAVGLPLVLAVRATGDAGAPDHRQANRTASGSGSNSESLRS